MKRSLCVMAAIAFCAMPATGRAQGFGILGGLSYGTVPNNGAFPGTLHSNDGFAIGLGAETGGVVGFGINGMYAQRGFTSSEAGFSQKLSYIDVPVYLKIKIPTPIVSPFVFAGPQASFEVNCDADGGTCPSGVNKTLWAGVIGAGVKFGALANLSIQGRYIYGLTDLNYSTIANSSSYKTRSFMLLAGIGF